MHSRDMRLKRVHLVLRPLWTSSAGCSRHAHDATQVDTRMSRAKLSASSVPSTLHDSRKRHQCDFCPRGFLKHNCPHLLHPDWAEHISRGVDDMLRTTRIGQARSVQPGRSVLAEQHLRSCAHQAGTRIALDRPNAYSASRDATPLSRALRCVTTALPDTQLVIRRQSSAPLVKRGSMLAVECQLAWDARRVCSRAPPPSRRLTASASRTTGESAKFASLCGYAFLPCQDNRTCDSCRILAGPGGAMPLRPTRDSHVFAMRRVREPHHPRRTRRKNVPSGTAARCARRVRAVPTVR